MDLVSRLSRFDSLQAAIRRHGPDFAANVRILVVVDGPLDRIRIGESAESGFGVGRVIRLFRESQIGGLRFEVDIATRENRPGEPGRFVDRGPVDEGEYRYYRWRFDVNPTDAIDPVPEDRPLNDYGIVLIFGWEPGTEELPDDVIQSPGRHPLSDRELRVLTQWMNAGGGLFATGDHGLLGASMCHRIPRVGSMRKWTRADGVPPASFDNWATALWPQRLNTVQPRTVAERLRQAAIPWVAGQVDGTPKPIDVVPHRCETVAPFLVRCHPHPLLEHEAYPSIDVMPDHDHEGLCQEPADIDPDRTLPYMPNPDTAEYPSVAGIRPLPEIVAYASTTASYVHERGPTDPRRFPLISAYDGHRIGIGRVVVDSTWHQWFDGNLRGIEAADGEPWDKIRRYFLNVARFLAPPGADDAGKLSNVLLAAFRYPGVEQFAAEPKLPFGNGWTLREDLHRRLGPVSTMDLCLDLVRRANPNFATFLEGRLQSKDGGAPGPSLAEPAWPVVEALVLGALEHAARPEVDQIRKTIERGEACVTPDLTALAKRACEAVSKRLELLRDEVERDHRELAAALAG